ncbi:cation:proton antiporter [Candidatus Micrarchaeota archaeon]|nr:cation:proton antiporter [Candidatus Micrarchaeota archaeon]MBU1930881.1 cation:proton antiporter [Candidatus Micrarchaeota archaeon]
MIQDFFLELAVVIVVATLLGFLFIKLKQPALLAFIFAGIILGSSFLNVITYKELLYVFSELGVAFLLFLVGINLDPRIFREIGKTSIVTGIGQIVFTTLGGFAIASFLGFGFLESLYIAIALTFSSTIIIVKLLSDKKELNSLYGKISIGFLLVQDFVAIIALVLISSFSFSVDLTSQLSQFVFGLIALFLLFFIASKFFVKRIFDSLSKSQELLFLGAISWCFAFAGVAILLGFSKEIGAFLAGVSIASLPYTYEVLGKLKYLRDFFIVLFFVVLGSNLVFTASNILFAPAIIFSIFVLVGNPIIVFILMAKLGYKGRTSFLSSLTVAQISEFSLILIFLGAKVGHVSSEVVSIITLVAVVTISASTYMIVYNNKIYDRLSNFLPVLRSKRFFEDSLHIVEDKNYSFVCLGFGETGKRILIDKKMNEKDILVVDFDPRALKEANKLKFNTLYGDVSDLETIDFILKVKPKVVVSTIMNADSNIVLAKKLLQKNSGTNLIVLAHDLHDAKNLCAAGIKFVLVPSFITADKVKIILQDIKAGRNFELNWLKNTEFKYDSCDYSLK